jgi:DNA-binding winged helix-turn-helix (wHTH) protein/Tol biopolymer transport system component
MPKRDAESIVRFGLFEADLHSGELRRNGQKTRLQEQPFQLLAVLLERCGEVVTREELRARLWPSDTFVDFDHGLNAAVKRLRDALGDSAENPRFVETLARRGYRFIAPVEPVPERAPQAAPSGRKRFVPWVFAAIVLAGVSVGWHAGHRSIAAARPGERRVTGNRANDPIWGAAISPDGKYVAFTYKDGLFLRVLSSGETHALPEVGNLKTHGVSWFPDGTRVLTTRVEGPSRRPELWSESLLGGTGRRLIENGEQGVVSPDGTQVAFVRGEYNGQEVWAMDTDGERPRKLLGANLGEFGSLTWSPDGKHLALLHYIYKLIGEGGEISVEICDLTAEQNDSGSKSRVVFSNSRLWNALAWTRNNRLIYSLSEAPPNRTDSNLWAQQIDSVTLQAIGAPVRLTSGPDGKARLTLSADGKRLSYLRMTYAPHVYVAEVNPADARLSALHRLSLDERGNYPYDWTADGKSIIFTSDRDGMFHLFKQSLEQPAPELLVGGDNNISIARMDPQGKAVLYLLTASPNDPSGGMRIMRMPIEGGAPQLVLTDTSINNFQCARGRANVCVLSQYAPDHLSLYTFDPVSGKRTFLKTIQDREWSSFNWSLSPDGTTLVLAKKHRAATPSELLFLRLDGGERIIPVDHWFSLDYLDWAADGKSVWLNAANPAGTPTLLNVALNGKIAPALEENEMVLGWAIPSRDGRHAAIWKGEQSSNAWLLEGF